MFGSSSRTERSISNIFHPCLQKKEAEAKQLNDWNPAYRKQEADAKHQKCLAPHQKEKEV